MTNKELDKKFEQMSRECAEKMNGTHPTKKTVKASQTKRRK